MQDKKIFLFCKKKKGVLAALFPDPVHVDVGKVSPDGFKTNASIEHVFAMIKILIKKMWTGKP